MIEYDRGTNDSSSVRNSSRNTRDQVYRRKRRKRMAKREKSRSRAKSRINVRTLILSLLELVFIGLIVYSSLNIYKWYTDNKSTQKLLKEIASTVVVSEESKQKYNIDFEKLKETNSDTVAWVKVNGTSVEYPVVQTTNNDYYLNHSFDKSDNGAGWAFVDYRNLVDGKDKNLVVYGHNRRDDSMFGTLKNILDKEWYDNKENSIVYFITEDEYCEYEVFSVYQTESEDYYITTDFKDNEFDEFVRKIRDRSIKDFGVDVSSEDYVLTLSTCANDSRYRVVLHAKKVYSEKREK